MEKTQGNGATPPEARQSPRGEWFYLVALALMGLVIFFYRLGAPGLMDPDEGRYAEIAREFFVLRDWLIPHLNLLPYLEKPPLVYWLTALSFKMLGYTELAARLPIAASALGGVFLAYGLGRAFWGPAPGFLGATVLATCAGYVALGRVLTLDMTFALFLDLAIGLGYLAMSRERRGLWPWAYLALGLAVLTKGPAAVVLGGLVWILWVVIQRRPWRPLVQPKGWLLLGAVTLPWFALVQRHYPDFFRFFVLEQHFGRFLTPAIHPEPVYFYVPVILGLMLPWTWLLPWALASRSTSRDGDRVFLLIWAGAILVFFSLSQGKLAPYILPALLPLALLLGERLQRLAAAGRQFLALRGFMISLLAWALMGLGLVVLYFWTPTALARGLAEANLASPYLLLVALVLALTPLLAILWRELGVLFLGAFLLSAMLPVGIDRLSVPRSPRQAGLELKSHWHPGAALVGMHRYSQGLSFYSGQVFYLLGCRTELDYGLKLAPESGLCLPDEAAVAALAAERGRVFLFLQERALTYARQRLPGKLELLAPYKDCLLVVYERQ